MTAEQAECTKCKAIKPLTAFTWQTVEGRRKPHPWCRECRRPGIRAHKAKWRGAPGKHTAADVRRLWVLQRGRCALCGRKMRRSSYHVDHVRALAAGGTNDAGNLQLTHALCNQRKAAKDPITHAQANGRLL